MTISGAHTSANHREFRLVFRSALPVSARFDSLKNYAFRFKDSDGCSPIARDKDLRPRLNSPSIFRREKTHSPGKILFIGGDLIESLRPKARIPRPHFHNRHDVPVRSTRNPSAGIVLIIHGKLGGFDFGFYR